MYLDREDAQLEAVAMEYLDLHSLYDILDINGVTQEELVVYLLRTGFIGLPSYLPYPIEEEEDDDE
jgi:hypothetical protein